MASLVRALRRTARVAAARPMMAPFRFGFARAMSTATRFTKDHEYVRPGANNTAHVGITAFAAESLGDVVFVELPEVGAEFKKGAAFGNVEGVKASSSIYAPVDAKVLEVNKKLTDEPGLINKAAETDAWLIKVAVQNAAQLNDLMDKPAYDKHVKESAH
eukprot:EW706430.1.p1 GENE.EW706430.1~~EW706430.1.p1  ORF type:complete len:160 (+),score=72.71 EW706430.1:62-541(+)